MAIILENIAINITSEQMQQGYRVNPTIESIWLKFGVSSSSADGLKHLCPLQLRFPKTPP